jgi:hypothetical protein
MLGHKLMDFFGRPKVLNLVRGKPSRLPPHSPYEEGTKARQFVKGHPGVSLMGRRLKGQGFDQTDRALGTGGAQQDYGFSAASYAGYGPGGIPSPTAAGSSPFFG